MDWKLIEVTEDRECTLDDSGVYAVISRINTGISGIVRIRVDIMTSNSDPLISFIGEGNAVRKEVINWLLDYDYTITIASDYISREHASYIGYEIARAMADENYKQD